MKSKEQVYAEYIGGGQMGIDFEKKDILEAMEVYASQFKDTCDHDICFGTIDKVPYCTKCGKVMK